MYAGLKSDQSGLTLIEIDDCDRHFRDFGCFHRTACYQCPTASESRQGTNRGQRYQNRVGTVCNRDR